MMPTPQKVAAFIGQPDDPDVIALATEHLPIIAVYAEAYTRGRGFDVMGEPTRAIGTVIMTATARLIANPEQIDTRIGEVSIKGGFSGWTLAETYVMNQYRKRTK